MTVTPVADPCVGNLATPVNSSYFTKAFINALPAYRPSLSPNRRGLEVGMAHGFFLYGPFAICGPLRLTEYASTAGLLATIGLVSILTVCLSLYGPCFVAAVTAAAERPTDRRRRIILPFSSQETCLTMARSAAFFLTWPIGAGLEGG